MEHSTKTVAVRDEIEHDMTSHKNYICTPITNPCYTKSAYISGFLGHKGFESEEKLMLREFI
jgi:hypothetical protein